MSAVAQIGNPPILPDDKFISLGTLANMLGGCPEKLESLCRQRGLEVDSSGKGWPAMRVEDLDTLLGPARGRSIRYGLKPEMCRASAAYHILNIAQGEVVALAERRGVLVDRSPSTPELSRSGVIVLARILQAEREFPILDSDWIRGEMVAPRLRSAMNTHVVTDHVDVSDVNAPKIDPDAELVTRCSWMGIRFRKEKTGKFTYGRVQVVGFDLYRLLGIELPTMNIEAYREMTAAAFAAVLPSQK